MHWKTNPFSTIRITANVMKYFVAVLMTFGFSALIHGQIDTLVLSNGDMIIGEMKDLKNNIVQIETDYSDSDFKIEWDKVVAVYTTTYFLVNTDDGVRVNGILRTDSE